MQSIVILCDFPYVLHRFGFTPTVGVPLVIMPLAKGHGISNVNDLLTPRHVPFGDVFLQQQTRGGHMKKIFILSSLIAVTLATTSFAEPTELDKKTVASKAYVDTKQDIIETGLVEFNGDDATINVPSVVTTNAAGTDLTGNQIGFMTLSAFSPTLTPFEDFAVEDNGDYFIPSAALVSSELNKFYQRLNLKQDIIPKSGYFNRLGRFFAYGQNSSSNGWLHAGVKGTGLVTKTATDGVVGERKIFEATDVANYHATGSTQFQQDIQDISIPTVGAMMGMISNAVNTLTWTATETTATQKYSTTFDGTANNWPTADANKIIDGTALANGLAQKQNKMTCAGWDSETHTDEHCWLWSIE